MTDVTTLVANARSYLQTLAYQSDERASLSAAIDRLEQLGTAIKPFATARIDEDDGTKLADWREQHDSEGVCLTWDPEFENGSTLTIGQFKRARAAYLGEAA